MSKYDKFENKVYEFDTKKENGFTEEEIESLCHMYLDLNPENVIKAVKGYFLDETGGEPTYSKEKVLSACIEELNKNPMVYYE